MHTEEPDTPPTHQRIEWALAMVKYKYFGDYEMTADQFEAVAVLVRAARAYIKLAEHVLHPPRP